MATCAVSATPDWTALASVLRREPTARPVLFEFFLNGPLLDRLAGPPDAAQGHWGHVVRGFAAAGYDAVPVPASDFAFPRRPVAVGASISQNAMSLIHDRAGFDAYPWPDPDAASDLCLHQAAAILPAGMGLVLFGPGGVLENVTELIGFDRMCVLACDDPDLLGEICDAVGSRLLRYYQRALRHPAYRFAIGNDDWGHKGGTVLSPRMMRRFILPWHERIVAAIHAAGRQAILHSCGRIDALMDDVIDGLHYDGKHSYEDVILPVEEAYERWGRRIAILGGIDVDFVCRSTPEAISARASAMLTRTATRGGYALGTGNSVPDYVPQAHWEALVAPARRARQGLG